MTTLSLENLWKFLNCKASFGENGMHAGVEGSGGAKDWHVMAEPSLWRCSAETSTCHMGQKHPSGWRWWVQKSYPVIATTESFLLIKAQILLKYSVDRNCSNTQFIYWPELPLKVSIRRKEEQLNFIMQFSSNSPYLMLIRWLCEADFPKLQKKHLFILLTPPQ